MYGISTREFLASTGLLKRVRLMAQYIQEQQNHEFKIDFEDYWEENFKGRAEPNECLEFFSHPGFPSSYYLRRVEPS